MKELFYHFLKQRTVVAFQEKPVPSENNSWRIQNLWRILDFCDFPIFFITI